MGGSIFTYVAVGASLGGVSFRRDPYRSPLFKYMWWLGSVLGQSKAEEGANGRLPRSDRRASLGELWGRTQNQRDPYRSPPFM